MLNVLFLILFSITSSVVAEREFVATMAHYVPMSDVVRKTLDDLADPTSRANYRCCNIIERPIYRAFPALHSTLAHVEVGDLPTPIVRLSNLEQFMGTSAQLYLKDDGITGKFDGATRSFGGNKIRKLEFLLGDALQSGARSVMTYGCIGSNHVVATGAACKQLGLPCIALLTPQEVTDVVKRNMLLMREYTIQTFFNPNREIRKLQTITSFVQNKYLHGDMPYFIPTGGSCPLGAIGYVNAVFELKEQIEAGIMPMPHIIYVPVGSCGTLAGTILGVHAAGLPSKVVGVAVEPDSTFRQSTLKLFKETNQLLHECDSKFPLFDLEQDDIAIESDYAGPNYGVPTMQTIAAIKIMHENENVTLDTTYSGKALAGMLGHLESGELNNKVVLFWNTFCSQVASPTVTVADLPLWARSLFV